MTAFKMCLAACGLNQEEAALVLDQSVPSISKKSAGLRRMTESDLKTLRALYEEIVAATYNRDPEGPGSMASALKLLRGERELPTVKIGRPRLDENDSK